MRVRSWFKSRAYGLLVGASVTTAVAGLYAAGRLDRIALQWLDLHFRHVNRIAASDRVLMIDINDYAAERIHRWPWPRRLDARLVSVLHELGARTILMDILFAEPMEPRLDHPGLSKDADVDPPGAVHGWVTVDDAIHDDDELAAAIRAAGNVYLAMYYQASPPGQPLRRLWDAAEKVLSADPLIPLDRFRQALPDAPGKDWETFYHQARIRHQLLKQFTLSRDELAERLQTPPVEIEQYLAPVKRAVAQELVKRVPFPSRDRKGADPVGESSADFRVVHGLLLPGQDFDARSPDREDVLRAYRCVRALRAAVHSQPEVPESLRGRLEQGFNVTPPLDKLAEAARAVGFVTFVTDLDGVVRGLPLVADIDGRLVGQLGFAVARDLLGIDPASVHFDGGRLVMSTQSGAEFRVPIDADGKTLINWHVDPSDPRWQSSFKHLPVTRVMELVSNRSEIEESERRCALRLVEAVEWACGGQAAAYDDYLADVRERDRLRRATGVGSPDQIGERDRRLAELDKRIEAAHTQALQMLELTRGQTKGLEPQSDQERAFFERVESLSADLLDGRLRADVDRINAALRVRNAELAAELRATVEGKACFVGYTAAAVSDFVNSPVFENMPGVLAHANLVNTFLQGRFPRMAARWMNVLLIALAGALVTLLTASRGPWVSLISVVLLIGLLLTASAAWFAATATYVASIVPAGAVFVCWAFITLYRQLVEERAKRQFAQALAQYTSPAVAAQIAEQARPEDLAPRPREVTCFFSDLQGFTSISERLGAERTRELLNPYLEAMSGVLIRHGAIINKFMGDGIFAFFNPPILPCADHARRACQAALDSLAGLERLKADYRSGPLADDVRALSMRVGLNSGSVFVGDYGSATKLDYTCIGDAVNLAARLEPANKAFGTRIMISEHTARQAGDGFCLRQLGRLQVVGKRQVVGVAELLGRTGEVHGPAADYAELFNRLVEQFQRRLWDDAAGTWERCAETRPGDPALALYRRLIDDYCRNPPPDDWNQGIELTSK